MKTDNYIDQLFTTARGAELVSSVDEIEKNLSQVKPTSSRKIQSLTPKQLIIMSTVLLLLGGFYFLFPPLNTNDKPKAKRVEVLSKKEAKLREHKSETAELSKPPAVIPHNIPPTIGTFSKPNKRSINNAFVITPKVEPKHVVVPYVPDFMPAGKVDKARCLTVNTHSIDMMNIHMIELTNDELLNLGIEVADKAIFVSTNSSKEGKPFKTRYAKTGSSFDVLLKRVIKNDSTTQVSESNVSMTLKDTTPLPMKKIMICENKEIKISINGTPDQGPLPISKAPTENVLPDYALITDDLGQLWRSYQLNYTVNNKSYQNDSAKSLNKQEMLEKANELREKAQQELRNKIAGFIPILVRSGDVNLPDDKEKKRWRADIIVWYEPTEKLFNALPPRIADDLRKEYQSVFVKNESSSCKYFETCKNIPGAIESFVAYPNPTEDVMNLEFNLKESRVMSAAIYTINGVEVKSVFKNQNFDKGIVNQTIHINDLPEGIYLLVVESNNGDLISKRVIRK